MTLNQISIFLENRPGQLAEITQELTEANINIFALNIAEASEYGLIRMNLMYLLNLVKILSRQKTRTVI